MDVMKDFSRRILHNTKKQKLKSIIIRRKRSLKLKDKRTEATDRFFPGRCQETAYQTIYEYSKLTFLSFDSYGLLIDHRPLTGVRI